ncbi:hypothetical protein QCA50_015023 [Cerrena zonata]|uniref:Piwi-domain-containing protein n=1 Tax=Cerrena zonata TaxID=2478898 RepID=A0AAW0FUW1_9APHY
MHRRGLYQFSRQWLRGAVNNQTCSDGVHSEILVAPRRAECASSAQVISTHNTHTRQTHLVPKTYIPHYTHIEQQSDLSQYFPFLTAMSQQQRGRGRGRGRGQGPPGAGGGVRDVPSPAPSGSSASSTRGGFNRGRGQSFTPGGDSYRGGPPQFRGGPRGGRGGGDGFRGRGGGRGGGPSHAGDPSRIFMANVPARVDDRLSTSDALIESFKREGYQPEKPLRPGWGTKGKAIVLRANFFPVTMPKDLVLYEYSISITPDKLPFPEPPELKTQPRGGKKGGRKGDNKLKLEETARILALLEQTPEFQPHLSYIAHDKSKLLTSARLLPQPLAIPVPWCFEGETTHRPDTPIYTVEITFTKHLRTDELTQYQSGDPQYRNNETLPVITSLNRVVQQHASRVGVRVGKNKFFIPTSNQVFPLTLGLEARQGFFVSVRPMYKQLMVNINVCMSAFYLPGNLADAMLAFQERTSGGMPTEFAEGLKVITRHLGYPRKRTITAIARTPASRTKFKLNGTQEVTVAEYFRSQYNINLVHANDIPVINIAPRGRQPSYLPAEICEIPPNQAFRGTLSGETTAAMIRVACNPPAYNAESIVNQGFPQLGLNPNAGPLQGFGISVSDKMTEIPARLLVPPGVAYKSGKPNVKDASWNIMNVKFQRGGDMTNWAVLLVPQGVRPNRDGPVEFSGENDPELLAFIDIFAKKCRDSGMTVPNTRPLIMTTPLLPPGNQDQGRMRALEMIKETLKGKLNPRRKPSFVLVLLSRIDPHIYPGIKRLCDVDIGIATVTMLLDKARKQGPKQDQYFSNVALKVNTKLGGINHTLDPQSMAWLSKVPTMLVGIDVTHPSPTSIKGTPSIAAVVASVDKDFTQFPASLRPQKNRNINKDAEEMVQELTDMMVGRLVLFERRNKRLPERMLVYRDGVSEGQYDLVIRHELPRILEAFKKFQGGSYRPKLTIVICGKRHHARNYGTGQDHVSLNGNTLPGCVVDKGITDVYAFDFYLQAHNGLQGNVKSTHYYIVYDENRVDADTIQEVTHRTSYLYARATKGVSLVPPAYYADLACERARYYLQKFLNLGSDTQSVISSGGKRDPDREREEVYNKAIASWPGGVHHDLQETMFYI